MAGCEYIPYLVPMMPDPTSCASLGTTRVGLPNLRQLGEWAGNLIILPISTSSPRMASTLSSAIAAHVATALGYLGGAAKWGISTPEKASASRRNLELARRAKKLKQESTTLA